MSEEKKLDKVKTIADELRDILDFWDQEAPAVPKATDTTDASKELDNIYEVQLPSIPVGEEEEEEEEEDATEESATDSAEQRRKDRLRDKINLREAYLRRKAEQMEAEEVNLDFDILKDGKTEKKNKRANPHNLDETTLSFQLGILDPSAEVDSPLDEQPFHDNCSLCKIVAGDMNVNVIYKDEFFTVILAPNGLCQGHLMIFPNGHYPQYMSIPASYHKVLHRLLPKLVLGLQKSDLEFHGVDFYFSDPIKQARETRHYSINLIPRNKADGLKISVNTRVEDGKKVLNTVTFANQLTSLLKDD